jgi:hypothetical protein
MRPLTERGVKLNVVDLSFDDQKERRDQISYPGVNYTLVKMPYPPDKKNKKTSVRTISFYTEDGDPKHEWLNYLQCDSSVEKELEEWVKESAQKFVYWLHQTVDIVLRRGRSVWFMACPLKRAFLSGSAGIVAMNHWGIVISQLTEVEMTTWTKKTSASPLAGLGDIHELHNAFGNARYQCRDFKAEDYERMTQFNYIGQTEMTDQQLHDYGEHYSMAMLMCSGNELIRQNPVYQVLKNNCQVWVEKFLSQVCPGSKLAEKSIAKWLESSSK